MSSLPNPFVEDGGPVGPIEAARTRIQDALRRIRAALTSRGVADDLPPCPLEPLSFDATTCRAGAGRDASAGVAMGKQAASRHVRAVISIGY